MYTSFTDWESGLYLEHHGVRGQKWGERRYQNPDGSLTAAGRAHYGVDQGGSRRMSRQYNRQVKKLNRLIAKADKDTQRANIEKYNKRAKTAMKVGNVAAGTAAVLGLGVHGLGRLAKNLDDNVTNSVYREMDRERASSNTYFDSKRQLRDLQKSGKISSGYKKELEDAAYEKWRDEGRAIQNEEYDYRVKNASKRDLVETIQNVKRYATYAAAGTAAVSYGVAAVSKLQARAAKTRLTDAGHQKAVQKARAQVAKMEKMFANTPYSELVKQQSKKANKS